MSEPSRPSLEDPVVTAASEVIGGPVGEHAAPHPWWTPVRVVLAVTALVFALGMVQKTPCVSTNWSDGQVRYAAMCYSDIPYLYTGRGFAEGRLPFSDTHGRYQGLEYPVVIGYFAYGVAVVTQAVAGGADLEARRATPVDQVYAAPGVSHESGLYFVVTAVLLGAVLLVAAWFMAGAQRGRPWDAMLFALSPALALAGLINWDILAVATVAGAFWAWARGRPVLTGVMIGLGTATKLYPMFLLGALFVVCLRDRRLRELAVVTASAAGAWLLLNAPPLLFGFAQWKVFWSFNSHRGADLGSLWLVWQQAGHVVTPETVNLVSWLFFGTVCVAVLVLGLRARRTPRAAQLAFLVVAGFLLVNKVYSPQYVLWLLPLAVLARPRWRDLLVWQAGEVFYFAAVWLYLGNFTASSVSGAPDKLYWYAIFVRVAAELYFVAMVVRDVLTPERDPVEEQRSEAPARPVSPSPVS
ncbi:MAG TPA: glycosyltransferase 87 family protein [Nocardioidaceae bacterium]|nr:glycosyltransferase 87 family protein [Nocardioidaceae bacterium]